MTGLAKLSAAATPGEWYAEDWQDDYGQNKTTVAAHTREKVSPGNRGIWPDGIEKIRIADTEEGESPLEDAAFIVALVNAYRAGNLIDPTDDEALARAGLMRKP